ncbi:MAG: hypothetical protein EOM03_15865 [Clostridia bacterium]|nr:hypothetical protein [Clostridia bacterium]
MAKLYVSYPQLVDIIGEADATALCKHYGGLALYVTKTPERSSLVGIISGAGIESLCAELPGIEIMLPQGPHRRVPIKEAVVAMLEAGASHTEVVRECGCTMRYSQMIAQDTRNRERPHNKPQKARREAERNA